MTFYDVATHSVAFWPILFIAALCSIPGAMLFFNRARPGPVRCPGSGADSSSYLLRALFWVFAAWTALHLLLIAVEIAWRPTFPWDAWTSWLYRAKAWFYAGALIPIDEPGAWVEGSSTALYNAPGGSYPGFTSAMALWPALALGQWHDSLVNFPVLLAGIALVMAFYGQCREAALPPWMAMLGSYLLVSTPLVGTHLSLGGMADIWMTGFVGLGLVEIIAGTLRGDRRKLALGFGLVALSLAVKNEGVVWLVAAVVFWGMTRWPRLASLALLSGVVVVGIAALSGIHSVDLPGLGKVGVVGERLYLPLLGDTGLVRLELWDDYLANFVQGDSWHLLWLLLLVVVFALLFSGPSAPRRALFSMVVLVLGMQLAIFQFTEHGQWAEQWTAINRIPLHVVPALLFALLLGAQHLRTLWVQRNKPAAWRVPWAIVPLAGLVVTAAGLLWYLAASQPAVDREPLSFRGGDLEFVAGAGERPGEGDGIRVTGFQNGVAVLSSGRVWLDPSKLSILQIRMGNDEEVPRRMRFFWRTTSDPQQISAVEFGSLEYIRSNLDESLGWSGTVTEVGLMLYGEAGDAVEVESLTLAPPSLSGSLRTLWHDWTFRTGWSQTSPNFLFAGASDAAVHLPVVMAAWVLVSALFVWVLRRRVARPVPLVIALGVAGWMLLDVRWTWVRLQQADQTVDFYGAGDRAWLDLPTEEKFLLERVRTSRELMQNPEDTVLILARGGESDFLVWRARYHYLPTPAFAHTGTLEEAPPLPADYALVVTPVNPQPGGQRSSARALARALEGRSGRAVSVIDVTDAGVFMRFGPEHE
ncbi:MAG: hypothetical protein U5K56_02255 [Halioglobus sp.]|nr:hypothetical protein [Halioglobus sp.]